MTAGSFRLADVSSASNFEGVVDSAVLAAADVTVGRRSYVTREGWPAYKRWSVRATTRRAALLFAGEIKREVLLYDARCSGEGSGAGGDAIDRQGNDFCQGLVGFH